MGVTFAEVMKALEVFAPLGLAEAWDRPGLQVGDPAARVEAVLVALDPSLSAIARATERNAQLLVTHHPLLLTPLHCLNLSQPIGRLLADCIGKGVAVYASHTNLDRAEGGVNDALAEKLGLVDVEPFSLGEEQLKLVVTVPLGYEPRVRLALAEAGGGRIGNYEGCAFSGTGTGTFRPLPGAAPFLGRIGALEEVKESRIEVVVPRSRLDAVREAVFSAHPYEEPALDLFTLEDRSRSGTLGRVGNLPRPMDLRPWAAGVARALDAPGLRTAGDPALQISRVAVCGGSGASMWPLARDAGAQALVTGDVKYHEARDASAAGLALVDAGHGATERVAVEVLADVLKKWTSVRGLSLRIETFFEPEPLLPLSE